jgi:adenylate cyclase
LTTSKKRTTEVTIVLIVASLVSIHLLFWFLPSVFETWNAQTIDQLFVFRSNSTYFQPAYDSTVIHVDLSDKSIEALRDFYLNRSHYAKVVGVLGDAGVAAQLWDYIFPARSGRLEDSLFISANARAANAYYGIAFQLVDRSTTQSEGTSNVDYLDYLRDTKWHVNVEGDASDFHTGIPQLVTLPDLARASKGLGYLSLRPDRDGVVRRAPLLIRYEDCFYPSFPFRAICNYLGVTPDRIVVRPGKNIVLKDAQRPQGRLHDVIIPIDRQGNMIVNWVGRWNRMKHYKFSDVLALADNRDDLDLFADEVKGDLVVVSEVSTGAADVRPVPTENEYPLSGLHANVLHTILSENFLTEWTGWQMFFMELLLMGILLVLAFQLSSRGLWIGAVLLLIGYLLIGVALFLYANTIVNVVSPSLMIFTAVFSIVAYRYINEEKEKESLRRSFESYFPPSVVRRIMANPEMIYARGLKKELTVMFTDIKSFTTYSSTMSPDQIQRMLNEYFEAMVDIVFKYEGTVDKFIGDGLMVFFGDPETQPDHALRCVRAAVEMQKKCRELKARWETSGLFPLKIRIGINTGPVVVGNMGSARRLSYTVLGSDVNLAQRLESNAPVEGIMISQRTYEFVKDHLPTKPLEPVKVKGLDTPIQVYEVPVEP